MPLIVQGTGAILSGNPGCGPTWPDAVRPTGRLDIGLVNNMPDAALPATERQFARILASGSGAGEVRLHLFSLAEVPRGEQARAYLEGRYGDFAALRRTKLDGLIVTGAEPVSPCLADEPYWDALTHVVDWAEHNTASTIWSCLAAHAAVLHLDGIARQRLARKRFGLFECVSVTADDLFDGMPVDPRVPHSRWNDLDEHDLRSHGYKIASRSTEAGVDCFTKRWASLFVFLQGHPEYDADSLYREYRRDAHRFLTGERDDLPDIPVGYFDSRTEKGGAVFDRMALRRREASTWDSFPHAWTCRTEAFRSWRFSAARLFHNWLQFVAVSRR